MGKNGKAIKFTLGDKNAAYKVLVTDLNPESWKVTSAAGGRRFSVSDTGGTLYFESKGGVFLIDKD